MFSAEAQTEEAIVVHIVVKLLEPRTSLTSTRRFIWQRSSAHGGERMELPEMWEGVQPEMKL